MIERSLFHIAFASDWGRQMRFITGPRQSGKTTLARVKLRADKSENLYYPWDLRRVKNRYRENELFFTEDKSPSKRKKYWVCFDEIHKLPRWKNILKGIFDQSEENYFFIITGSAKLNISRLAGDSLSGRYFTFHLFPLCLGELNNAKKTAKNPPGNAMDFIMRSLDARVKNKTSLPALLEYGGFPEPFLRQSKRFQRKWSDDYPDRVINEDIASLTRITDREYLYDLYRLLPEMAGNPVSFQSLASHLELSITTVKNHLRRLEDFYLVFKVPPYSKNIKRSLLKKSKYYLYDWTGIKEPGVRFENFIACELHTLVHLWMNETGERYDLFYIRDKERKETDFLILKENIPWLLIEAKISDTTVAGHHLEHSRVLGSIPLVQICYEHNRAIQQKKNVFRISANRFFSQ